MIGMDDCHYWLIQRVIDISFSLPLSVISGALHAIENGHFYERKSPHKIVCW